MRAPCTQPDRLQYRERDAHLPLGEGQVDWRRLLRQLAGIGCSGTMILEIAGHDDCDAVLDGARRARRHLREIASTRPLP